jgi:AcrR family transcriptional regulator
MSAEPGQKPARGRRGRPKVASDATHREAVTRAAWTCFLERGYGRTTMGDVAAVAHMSLSTIYRFFPSKTDLFSAVVALHRQSMLALPGAYDDLPLDVALGRIFQIDLDDEARRQREALMTMLLVESRQFPELETLLHEHGPQHAQRLLAEWLERQQRLNRLAVSDAGIAAKMLMDVVFGATSLKSTDAPQWPGGDDRPAYLRHCFSMIAEGLKPRDTA